jgi:sugar lactone lactonase YvrE
VPEIEPHVATSFIDGVYFGEAPRWHDGRLWFSDFYAGGVFSVDERGDRRHQVEYEGQTSGLGWLPDGDLLVVSMLDHRVLRQRGGTLEPYADLSPWATGHANDMVVSATGHAYVGNFGFDLDGWRTGSAEIRSTSLVRIDPDGTASAASDDMAFPNGTVIFPDGKTLVIAETFAARLTAFDVAKDGTLSNRRVWAQLENCAPDGICLDAEGCVWVANATAAECVRVAEGGAVVGRLVTEQPCFACMLGGADRSTLYAMVAPSSEAAVVRTALSGGIATARVEVPGAGLP